MATFFAFFGIGTVLGILFTLALLIPLGIYIIYCIVRVLYTWGYILIYGIDPSTGKPPDPLSKT